VEDQGGAGHRVARHQGALAVTFDRVGSAIMAMEALTEPRHIKVSSRVLRSAVL
jgi:hypothetical protein